MEAVFIIPALIGFGFILVVVPTLILISVLFSPRDDQRAREGAATPGTDLDDSH